MSIESKHIILTKHKVMTAMIKKLEEIHIHFWDSENSSFIT